MFLDFYKFTKIVLLGQYIIICTCGFAAAVFIYFRSMRLEPRTRIPRNDFAGASSVFVPWYASYGIQTHTAEKQSGAQGSGVKGTGARAE